jgi:hypothetical protein
MVRRWRLIGHFLSYITPYYSACTVNLYYPNPYPTAPLTPAFQDLVERLLGGAHVPILPVRRAGEVHVEHARLHAHGVVGGGGVDGGVAEAHLRVAEQGYLAPQDHGAGS